MTRIQFNNGFLVLFSEPYLCLSLLPFSLEVFLLYTHIIGVFTSTGVMGYKGIRVTFCNVFKWRKVTLLPCYRVTPVLVNTPNASLQLFGSAINHYLLKIYTLFPLKTSDWNLLQSKAVI